jgi:excisionase family DNA binding protein
MRQRFTEPPTIAETNGHATEQPALQIAVPVERPLLLTRRQLAALLELSERTIKRMTALGAIPGVCRVFGRSVRYDRRSIESWIAKGTPPIGGTVRKRRP